MASRSEKVLITGASGFTGRVLVRHMREHGYLVEPLANSAGGSVDLCDKNEVDAALRRIEPDLVYHLAGISTNLHPDIGQIYKANVVGTANLLSCIRFLEKRPRGIILASSATVYAPPPDGGRLTETSPLRPSHHYGSSKLAAEEVARHFSKDLPILVVRPFNYTGPGQSEDFIIAKLVQHFARRDTTIRMGNMDVARDFMSIDTILDVYRRLASLQSFQGVVNIASGRTISLREVIRLLEERTGHTIRIEVDPRFLRHAEAPSLFGSTARLHELIGPVEHPPFGDVLAGMLAAASS